MEGQVVANYGPEHQELVGAGVMPAIPSTSRARLSPVTGPAGAQPCGPPDLPRALPELRAQGTAEVGGVQDAPVRGDQLHAAMSEGGIGQVTPDPL